MFSAIMSAQSLTNAVDLLVLKAPTDHHLHIKQVRVTADVATAAVSGPIALYSASSLGTGSTGVTPVSWDGAANDPWSAYTAKGASAGHTPSGATTKVDLYSRVGADLRAGFLHTAKHQGLIVLPPSGIFVVRLDANLGGATVLTAEILFELL